VPICPDREGPRVEELLRNSEPSEDRTQNMEKRENERFVVRQFRNAYQLKKSYPYRVVNISKSGCALESSSSFQAKDGKILFELPLPSKTESLSLEATIVWEERLDAETGRPSYLYGVCFEEMDHLSRLILDAYLGFLRRDTHIAQLEDAWEKLKRVQERIEVLIACEEKKEVSFFH